MEFTEVASAISLMLRDLRSAGTAFPIGTVLVILTMALPVMSLLMAVRGCVYAWFAFAIAVALYGQWFLYYATDWWSNPGQGVWIPAALAVLLGWGFLVAAARSEHPGAPED